MPIMQKRKRQDEDSSKFNPLAQVANDIKAMKVDKYLAKIAERKEREWDSLPIIKRYDGREVRARVDDIIYKHHHHPTTFLFNKWVKEIPEMPEDEPPESTNIPNELCSALNESEFYNGMEKFRMKQNPIFNCTDLREYLDFFLENFNLPFNFICTEIGVKGQVALISNICSFDIIYFCTVITLQNANISNMLRDFITADGVILLKYEFNSETVANEPTRDNNDDEDQPQPKKAKKKQEDNMQFEEYKRIVRLIKNAEMEIQSMFYFCCPCIENGKVRADDAKKCINNEC
jgi:hypothetical protein